MKTLTQKQHYQHPFNFKKRSVVSRSVLKLGSLRDKPLRDSRKTKSYESLIFLYGPSD